MKVIDEVAVGRFTLILVFAGLILLSLGSSPPVGQTQSVSPEVTAVSDAIRKRFPELALAVEFETGHIVAKKGSE